MDLTSDALKIYSGSMVLNARLYKIEDFDLETEALKNFEIHFQLSNNNSLTTYF